MSSFRLSTRLRAPVYVSNLGKDLSAWQWRILTYAFSTAASIAWTIYAGKDLNWDSFNYHLYAGYSALNNRFQKDFFAANIQGYLTPYAHIPFYLMVKAGWPAIVIGIVFTSFHSLNFWLTYELTLIVNRCAKTDRSAAGIGILAVLLAALNPVLLQELGSTFTDISTGAFVLAGWLCLARAFYGCGFRFSSVGGLLLGIAAALKLSNAIYAIAALPVVMMLPNRGSDRLKATVFFSLSCGVAFVITSGPWALHLWENFHNPFFPMFNSIFASQDFPVEPLKDNRFIPDTFMDALLRPILMISPEKLVHTEPRAPDIRYFLLTLLLCLWTGLWMLDRRKWLERLQFHSVSNRALLGITFGFLFAWCLWLDISGNSRYFLPMSCVASVLLASLLYRLLIGTRTLLYILLVFFTIQLTQAVLGASERWVQMPWGGSWFNLVIPTRLKQQPYFYISYGSQSNSFFIPFLAKGSAMMNIGWPHVLTPDGPGGERAKALIRENMGNLRTLVSGSGLRPDGSTVFPDPEAINARLWRFDLQVDASDCEQLSIDKGDVPIVFGAVSNTSYLSGKPTQYLSCKLIISRNSLSQRYLEQSNEADIIFNRIEDACPKLFQPRRAQSENINGGWSRSYLNTDIQLWLSSGTIKFINPMKSGEVIIIGRESEWLLAPQTIDCHMTYKPSLYQPVKN